MSLIKYKIDGDKVVGWQKFDDNYEHFVLGPDEIMGTEEFINTPLDELEYKNGEIKLKPQSYLDEKKENQDRKDMISNKEYEIINRMAIQELTDEGKL